MTESDPVIISANTGSPRHPYWAWWKQWRLASSRSICTTGALLQLLTTGKEWYSLKCIIRHSQATHYFRATLKRLATETSNSYKTKNIRHYWPLPLRDTPLVAAFCPLVPLARVLPRPLPLLVVAEMEKPSSESSLSFCSIVLVSISSSSLEKVVWTVSWDRWALALVIAWSEW